MKEYKNFDLTNLNTLKIKAISNTFLELEKISEAKFFKAGDFILGGGSNTVFLNIENKRIIKPLFNKIELIKENKEEVFIRAEAGVIWQDLVNYTCSNNFSGLENLAGIYGTVGAAAVQNIGAYGVEAKDFIVEVEVFDNKIGEFYKLKNQDCNFAYRFSIFKKTANLMVLAIIFKLKKSNANVLGKMQEIIEIRNNKLPNPKNFPNAGSFFKNPIIDNECLEKLIKTYPKIPNFAEKNNKSKLSAAWLIENSGFKGKKIGNIGMAEKHALILVNYGGSGREIWDFAQIVKKAVWEKFNINLEPEVVFVGDL